MALIDDKLLEMRFAQQPEFLLRLHEFAQLRRISNKSALVIQARPFDSKLQTVDLSDNEVCHRFAAGANSKSAWWNGFSGFRKFQPTFHGIGINSFESDAGWASELHRDGHFIAGLWKYPEISTDQGKKAPAIGDFYAQAFVDFFAVVSNTVRANERLIKYQVTATLLNARNLYYVAHDSWTMSYGVRAKPLDIDNLQWMIFTEDLGSEKWEKIPTQMGNALKGVYLELV